MNGIIRNKMQLKVLTGVHIGGSENKTKRSKRDYAYDKDNQKLYLIDINKFIDYLVKNSLFNDYIYQIESDLFSKHKQNRVFDLWKFLKDKKIKIENEDFVKRSFNCKDRPNDVYLFGRTIKEKIYIPGSSIKGAILNLLMVDYIIKHRKEFYKEKNEILTLSKRANRLNEIKNFKKELSKFVSEIENKIFNEEKNIGISVSDTYKNGKISVGLFKDYDKNIEKDEMREMTITREYVTENSVLNFDINLDIELLNKTKLNIKNIDDLIMSLDNATDYLFNDVLKENNYPQGVNLILGSNTGFHQKTIVHALYDDLKERLEVTKKILHKKDGDKISDHLKDKNAPRILNKIKRQGKEALAGLVKIEKVGEKVVIQNRNGN